MCFEDAKDETFEQGGLWHRGPRQAFGPLLLVRGLGTPRTILSSELAWLLLALLARLEWSLACQETALSSSLWAMTGRRNSPTSHKVVIGAKLPSSMQDLLGAGRFRHGFPDPAGSLQGFPRRHPPGRLAVPLVVCSAAPCPAELPKLVHVSGVCSV